MTRPRERRPRAEPVSAEEEAEIERKYRELYRLLKRLDPRRAGDREDASADPEESPDPLQG